MSIISARADADLLSAPIACHKSMSPQSYPVIASWHLELRPFSLSDIPWFANVATVNRSAITTHNVRKSFNAHGARRWIESHPLEWQRRRAVHWVIWSLEESHHRGYVGLHDIQISNRRAELRFWTAERIGHILLTLEAAQAAVSFAFTCLQTESVLAYSPDSNPQVSRILRQFGMQRGTNAPDAKSRWQHSDEVVPWSVSRSHWAASLQGTVIN